MELCCLYIIVFIIIGMSIFVVWKVSSGGSSKSKTAVTGYNRDQYGGRFDERNPQYDRVDENPDKDHDTLGSTNDHMTNENGVKRCPSCGEDVENLVRMASQDRVFCPRCGVQIDISEMRGDEQMDGELKEEKTPVDHTVDEGPVIFECPECSMELSEGDTECVNCGVIFEREEVVLQDGKSGYESKIEEWRELGFEVDDLEGLLVDGNMERFEEEFKVMKEQIEG